MKAILAGTLIAIVAAAAAIAQTEGGDEAAVEQGREAFQQGRFPWYDGPSDALLPMEFYEPPDWDWGWSLPSMGRVIQVLGWTLLALAIAVFIGLLFRFARRRAEQAAVAVVADRDAIVSADQVEAFPFLAERAKDDLLGRARRHYQEGNYSEAIIYLFSHQLVELDRFAVIRLAQGKTNRQYLRESSRAGELKTMFERTMLAFEDVFFGRRTLDRADFEACWNSLGEFERQLQSVT